MSKKDNFTCARCDVEFEYLRDMVFTLDEINIMQLIEKTNNYCIDCSKDMLCEINAILDKKVEVKNDY